MIRELTRTWQRRGATAMAALMIAAPAARAQTGPFVGIQYAGSSLNVEGAAENLSFGGGFGVHAGLSYGTRWAVLANFDRSVLTRNNTDVRLTQYDALLRANVLPAGVVPLRLFLTGGVTARTANQGEDFESIAPTGGAGVQLFVTPRIAASATALWTFGNLTRAEQLSVDAPAGTFRSTQTRVQVGLSLYPFGR
jgi:hypothetical protein